MNPRARAAERAFAVPVMVAALLVIPLVVLDTRGLGGAWPTILAVGNWLTWTAFAAEAATMLWLVDSRWQWLHKHPQSAASTREPAPERANVVELGQRKSAATGS